MHLECGAYHEIDLEGLFRPVTKWCGTVRDGRPDPGPRPPRLRGDDHRPAAPGGPVPATGPDGPRVPERPGAIGPVPGCGRAPEPPEIPRGAIEAAAALLASADRPIVLAGGGALWAGAGDEVRELARAAGRPGHHHAQRQGPARRARPRLAGPRASARARAVLPHADAMLAVGCRFTEVMTDWQRMPVPKDLVQIDLDPDQVGMNYPVAVGIVADAKAALEALLRTLPVVRPDEPLGRDPGAGPRRSPHTARVADRDPPGRAPRRGPPVHRRLRNGLPSAVPTGPSPGLARSSTPRTTSAWAGASPRRSERPSRRPDRPVVSVSGDGGFVMTAQELATAARYRLRLVALVHNDSAYGAIKNIQQRRSRGPLPRRRPEQPRFPPAGRRLRGPRGPFPRCRRPVPVPPRGPGAPGPEPHRSARPLAIAPRVS